MTAASATYKINTSAPLPVAVKVRMQHCSILEKDESLTLMVAAQGPPYYFKPLPGAKFPPHSSYGEIELQSFSFFQFLKDLWSRRPMRLSLQVFYHKDSTATFTATKNIPPYVIAVKKSISHVCSKAVTMSCNTDGTISLSVPTDSNGWHITSEFEPAEIKTVDIDNYEPMQTCPKIILHMEWKGSGNPSKERVRIPINGGSLKSFALLCGPTPQEQGHHLHQAQLPQSSPTTQFPIDVSSPPTLPLLLQFPKRSGGFLNIIEEVTVEHHNLGICLLNDNNGAITSNIEAQYRPDQTRITKAIFQKWLRGTGKSPRSWATLITILREMEHRIWEDISDRVSS